MRALLVADPRGTHLDEVQGMHLPKVTGAHLSGRRLSSDILAPMIKETGRLITLIGAGEE